MPATLNRQIDDVRIKDIFELAPPSHLLREFPVSEQASKVTFEARAAIHRMLHAPLLILVLVHSVPAVYLAVQRWGWIRHRGEP